MMSLTTSPIEITPTTLPASSTGRWRKPRAAIIAMQPSSWSSGLTVTGSPVITWPTGVCFASSPGSSTFMAQSPLGHDTDQDVVVDDQHRPDPVVAHLAQGFDDHVAGTNMDQGATLLGQSVFDCVHRAPLMSPVLARLSGTH